MEVPFRSVSAPEYISGEELSAAGADSVAPDLKDPEAVLAALP